MEGKKGRLVQPMGIGGRKHQEHRWVMEGETKGEEEENPKRRESNGGMKIYIIDYRNREE